MKITHPEKRLQKFWGKVDRKHIQSLAGFLTGNTVLDMGCGYGTTTSFITGLGYNCTGIDSDPASIDHCRREYPHCRFIQANAEQLPFDNWCFDTIVLRDALHHFYEDADFDQVKREILRVARVNSRAIFFDPNVNFLVKTLRKISFHQDEECSYQTATGIMKAMGYTVIHHSYNTVYSLPLSGGYVGINFVPNVALIQNGILSTEGYMEQLISKLGLGRHLCWRYLIVGEK